MAQPRILLTGATGYIGGSILSHVVKSNNPALQTITCLVRGEDRVSKLKSVYGDRVHPVLYKDLDDVERAVEVASSYDIIVNVGLGYHPESAAALVRGLAKRKEASGRDVFLIHTSGTSNLADRPISGLYQESNPERVFDDSKDDIYAYEQERNASVPYGQRTSELGVIDEGVKLGVKTIVIMSPTIYGIGTGAFNRGSIQVPAYVHATLVNGQAVVVGEGKGVWDNVHIEDLAELYEAVLIDIINGGKNLPFGKKGIMFSGAARHTWMGLAQGVADAAVKAGKITDRQVRSVDLEEGAKILTGHMVEGGDELLAELGLSSNSRTESTIARKLGWRPTRSGDEAWKKGFSEEVQQAIEKGTA